jgi:hypothetical protein
MTPGLAHNTTVAARHSAQASVRASTSWKMWVALLTVLAFLIMVFVAGTHHHPTAQSEDDCFVCSAAFDNVADVPPPSAVVILQRILLLAYLVYVVKLASVVLVRPKLSPPSCGPPHAFAAS